MKREVDEINEQNRRLQMELDTAKIALAKAEAEAKEADEEYAILMKQLGPRNLRPEFSRIAAVERPQVQVPELRRGNRMVAMSNRDGFSKQVKIHSHYIAQIAHVRSMQKAKTKAQIPLYIFLSILLSVVGWALLSIIFP